VVIVAGKGGVGKTTVTATLAVAATRAGMTVLIAEVEGKSGLAGSFGAPALTYDDAELAPGVRARTLSPDAALLDYLETHGMKRISKRLAHSGALDVVATAVPGMKDILVLGKVKSLEQERAADLIIVDAPAAGHAITFLLSAQGLLDAVRVGPVRKQATDVAALLGDPARCQVILVTLPEETPVNELVDTAFAVEDRAGVALGPVVVNCCLDPVPALAAVPSSTPDAIVAAAAASGGGAGSALALDTATAVRDAATFRAERAELQRTQLERLATRLPLPQIRLPFLFTATIGPSELDTLTDAFVAGVGALA
jgi:anion-transporting  ArsA/GET3 family ATPase